MLTASYNAIFPGFNILLGSNEALILFKKFPHWAQKEIYKEFSQKDYCKEQEFLEAMQLAQHQERLDRRQFKKTFS